MKEDTGDLWTYPAELHVITTNGQINARGKAVMGAGCAREARDKFPGIDETLAYYLRKKGNHVFLLGHWSRFSPASTKPGWSVASFPVKQHWSDNAEPALIKRSVAELIHLVDRERFQSVVIPRPGCGNGGLEWEDVRPLLEPLDDRFTVITFDDAVVSR